ncbi:MAG TPA: GAF domain-containing protein [Anaerolineales bacterium]|nr:GAF domain-containing protein [Anaerolineales bacterium]
MTQAGSAAITTGEGARPATGEKRPAPVVVAIADVESNAQALVQQVLIPAGLRARTERAEGPRPEVLVVDVTQLRGDPLASLRRQRESGEDAPAIILAAHLPPARLRDVFRLGVRDILLKPYRPPELVEAILELCESRSSVTAAQHLSQRLEAARERSQRHTDEIALLSEIGRAVATLGDLDLILKRVAEAASYITSAEETDIYLLEPGSQAVILRASKLGAEKHASLRRLRVEDNLVGQVFHTGKPILQQPRQSGTPVKVQTGFLVQSLIMVPLRVRERAVGVLGVYNPVTSRPFDDHHLTLMVNLSDWASVALEHAAMLHQARNGEKAGSVTAVAPDLFDGLDQALLSIETLLSGTLGQLTATAAERLRLLQENLKRLRALPVATLDPVMAEGLVDLPGLVRQTVEVLRSEAERKGLSLEAEPSPPSPLFKGDSGRLIQVIEGLTEAAIRRTNKGGIILRTWRFAVRGGRTDSPIAIPDDYQLDDGLWAGVRVSDTSAGLSPDTESALSSASTDPEAGKTGPGLSMGELRMIAESLDGGLIPERGRTGTSISFLLPIA